VNNIQLANYPTCSLYLNLIEHVWIELTKLPHKQHPGFVSTPGCSKKIKAWLAQVPPER